MTVNQQIPLNIYLDDNATFANFFVGEKSANRQILSALQKLCDNDANQLLDSFLYLWGSAGAGLSHLLQAACHDAQARGMQSQYLPLVELAGFEPEALLEGLEHLDLVCIDDLQQVVGRPGWDEAIFHFYNRARERRIRVLISAKCAPRDLASPLSDLVSRLASGITYRVEAMDDLEKQQALQRRALSRGLEMSDEVARFILSHGSREPRDLFDCLEKLDRKSLAEKRRLTIPLVKEIL